MPEETEKAYLAGVIDSDGCVMVYKSTSRPNYYAVLDICQANIEDLQKLQKIWGGKIEKHTRSNHLRWCGEKAFFVLQEIFPYAKFKNEQITLFMMLFDTFGEKIKGRFIPKMKKMREFIYWELRKLKREKYA